LPHFGIVVRFAQNGEAGMRVQIDKAGTDHVIGGVDDPGGLQMRRVTAVHGDAFVLDEHGGVEARAATAVDDEAVVDQ
jgi:hypothetical protein